MTPITINGSPNSVSGSSGTSTTKYTRELTEKEAMDIWLRGRRNVDDRHLIDQNQIAADCMINPLMNDNYFIAPHYDLAKHSRPGLKDSFIPSRFVMFNLYCDVMDRESHELTQYQSNMIARSPAISELRCNASIATRHMVSTANDIDTVFGHAKNYKSHEEKKEAGKYHRSKAYYVASPSRTQYCTKSVSCSICHNVQFIHPKARQFFCQRCNGFSSNSS